MKRCAATGHRSRCSIRCRPARRFTISCATTITRRSSTSFSRARRRNRAMAEGKKGVVLSGVVAGKTAICTVGREGKGLQYRGYEIADLAARAEYLEVAHLLLYEKLPTKQELESFRHRVVSLRGLPDPLRKTLELLPRESHAMDVMRTGCSLLGCIERAT